MVNTKFLIFGGGTAGTAAVATGTTTLDSGPGLANTALWSRFGATGLYSADYSDYSFDATITGDFTVELWFGAQVAQSLGGSTVAEFLYIGGNESLTLAANGFSGQLQVGYTPVPFGSGGVSVNLGAIGTTPTHLVIQRTVTDGKLAVYRDGVRLVFVDYGTAEDRDPTGMSFAPPGSAFVPVIDELRVSSVARYLDGGVSPASIAVQAVSFGAGGSGQGDPTALAAAPGPLGAPAVLAAALVAAYAGAPGPLGAPAALVTFSAQVPGAYAAAPGPLGAPAVLALHDFTGAVGSAVTLFVMDLLTPGGAVRVGMSSWQATLQTTDANYVQCVVPACGPWVDAINDATEFVIYRRAALPNGTALEYEMARAPAQQVIFDRGPERYTCTLSGYADGFAPDLDPPAAYDRALVGVRSVSTGTGGVRVRCAVDWLLRPGHRAQVDGQAFVVDYINYYSPSGFDAYMDVGSRP